MQWYPGDWRKDPGVQALSYEERGVWFELLMLMHDCEQRGKLILNGKPIENHRIGLMLRLTEGEISHHISQLISLGVASLCEETGALMCRRMVRDDEKRSKLSDYGKLGGNPAFKKGKDNPYHKPPHKPPHKPEDKPEDKPNISPSSSSSSSIQTPTPQAAGGELVPATKKRSRSEMSKEQAEWFQRWWNIVWMRKDRGHAEKAWASVVRDIETFDSIMAAMPAHVVSFMGRSAKYWPLPATWLNGKRWLDELEPSANGIEQQSSLPDFDDMMNDPYHGGKGVS